jgi:hypothetical protein
MYFDKIMKKTRKKATGSYIFEKKIIKENKQMSNHHADCYGILPKNMKSSLNIYKSSGKTLAPPSLYEERINICRVCSFWEEDSRTGYARCKKCGCSSSKILLLESTCPLESPRW